MSEVTKNDLKLAEHFERVINNLNQHWESIQILLAHVSNPLLVDDRGLQHCLRSVRESVIEIDEKLRNTIESMDRIDISKTYQEIKFMGKRLWEIEQRLDNMEKKGIDQNVKLNFSCDGYKLKKVETFVEPEIVKISKKIEKKKNKG